VCPPPKSPNGVLNPNTNRTWYLPPASPIPGQPPPANSAAQYFALLTYEPDTDNEETVTVTSDGKGGYQATFYKQHPDPVKNPNGTVVVISRGNPGPWTVPYNPSLDSAVVPYSAQIN
jgi:hypothetical protein